MRPYLLLLISLVPFPAAADILSIPLSVSGLSCDIGAVCNGSVRLTLDIPQFDPSLGSLNSVSLHIRDAMLVTTRVGNDFAVVGTTGNFTNTALFNISSPGIDELYYSGTVDFTGSSTREPFPCHGCAIGSYISWDLDSYATDLTPWEGLGAVELNLGYGIRYDISVPSDTWGFLFAANHLSVGASVTASYDYTLVPEPGALLLIALCGCLGLVAFAAHRSQ